MSIKDRLRIINEGMERAQQFVREHARGSGGVGFADIDTDPLVTETTVVVGKPVAVKTDEGNKTVYPEARIVTLQNGEIEIIRGGAGTKITVEDAYSILNREDKRKLTKALRVKNSTK